ncbi:MAG: thioredoxin family protein [Hyphomicrobiales bacterium]
MFWNRRQFLSFAAAAGFLAVAPSVGRAKGKLELIMFEQLGCPWCAKWEAEVGVVYHKTYEGKRAPVRRVNIYGDRPPELVFVQNIMYSPTFVLIEGGREIGRITGYPGEAHFYVQLSKLLDDYDKGRSKGTTQGKGNIQWH